MSPRRPFSEPLLQFAVLGALLFVGYRAWGPRPADEIVVDPAAVDALARDVAARTTEPIDETQRAAIVQQLADEEILVREAKALGLDRGDPIVRRRLAQKMRFVLEDEIGAPTDAQLQTWVQAHPDRYRRPQRRTFEQRFFAGASARDRAERARDRLLANQAVTDADGFVHGRRHEAMTRASIASRYGDGFASAVMQLPPDRWEVVASTAGWHVVRVEAIVASEVPSLDEVREAAEADWRAAQARDRVEAGLKRLRDRYRVRVGERTP